MIKKNHSIYMIRRGAVNIIFAAELNYTNAKNIHVIEFSNYLKIRTNELTIAAKKTYIYLSVLSKTFCFPRLSRYL